MRVLVLTPTFLPVVGGAELALLEIYRRLAARHQVLLVTPILSNAVLHAQGSDDYDRLVTFPVERFQDTLTFMRIPGHRATCGAIPPFSLSAVTAIGRAVRRFKPDVLHVHYLMPTGLAGLVAERRLGIPTVVTMNGRDVPGPAVPALWRWWQRTILSRVTDVTYGSMYARDAICGKNWPRGQVVYNGVEIPSPTGNGLSVHNEHGIPPGEPVVFSLQRLGPEKRVDVVLRAFKRCRDQTGVGTLVVGGKGPEEEGLRRLAQDLGIARWVRFAGYISKEALPSYFLGCQVFAFHSTFETFGIVVAQAMSYGRAVVTVRNTALPEVVGEGGLLVETADDERFGDAIATLLKDPALRQRLGEVGRVRAATHFNWDRIAEQYETVLTRATARRT